MRANTAVCSLIGVFGMVSGLLYFLFKNDFSKKCWQDSSREGRAEGRVELYQIVPKYTCHAYRKTWGCIAHQHR